MGYGAARSAGKLLTALISFFILSCVGTGSGDERIDRDGDGSLYKGLMREFVMDLSAYTRAEDRDFIIVPQNGQELVTVDGNESGDPHAAYLNAIDGTGREDLYYGYDLDDRATPAGETAYMNAFLKICADNNVMVLTTDYCSSQVKMEDSYAKNEEKGYISFAAPERSLNVIPGYPASPHNVNSDDVVELSDAKNFLYLINPENYPSKSALIAALSATDYDLIIMDLFLDGTAFSAGEIDRLKRKHNGGARLVIAYMSIGEAEDYRYYWDDSWEEGNPSWIAEENPDWEGNYKVRYWDKEWQALIFGNSGSYLDKILDARFDGVYLDIIDGFEYFE